MQAHLEPTVSLAGTDGTRSATRHAVVLLQVFAFLHFVIPPDVAIKEISAAVFPSAIVALVGLTIWVAAVMLGQHDPRRFPNPVRLSLLALWVTTLLSYIALHLELPEPIEMRGGDRWILQVLTWTAIIVIASEFLRNLDDLHRVIRAAVWGGTVMGVVAVVQFRFRIDLADQLRQIPGFTIINENIGIDARASQARVAGTALHAIELGVTAGALLPLAVVTALYRGHERSWTRWIPVALIAACIPVSVSRSAIIALVVSMGTLIICMDAPRRLRAMMLAPVGVMAMFLSAPGLIGTFKNFFSLGSDDTSIAKRQRQIPLVEQLISERPLFGRGGGTWLPPTPETILDNQYYRQTIENGLIGSALITLGYFVLPPAIAIVARHRARDPELRLLGGALAGAAAVSIPIAMTFDSLAFPMYAGTQALVVGLIGAYWLVVRTESSDLDDSPTRSSTRESSSASPSSI